MQRGELNVRMIRPGEYADQEIAAIRCRFDRRVSEIQPLAELTVAMKIDYESRIEVGDDDSTQIRQFLRQTGFKPTGRSKPASEYLRKVAEQDGLASINVPVDVGNAVSLHSRLPISVVDASKLSPPLHIAPAKEGASYVFNPSGQCIDVAGLLCLHDSEGPCANAVKDAQRTKTDAETDDVMVIIWGTSKLTGRTLVACQWLQQLMQAHNADCESALE